jgi:Pyrimidine dimer DNA glycosylase
MRLWTLHPKYLDSVGLVALWREALLARAVLRGETVGYRHHPQLTRFRAQPHPVASVNRYLAGVYAEARCRGYDFDRRKLGRTASAPPIRESAGQLAVEWTHLLAKLRVRQPPHYRELLALRRPAAHPLFYIVPGPVRSWERLSSATPKVTS